MEFEGKDLSINNHIPKEIVNSDQPAFIEGNQNLKGNQQDKNFQLENTEDVIKYSNLILEGNNISKALKI